MKDSIKGKTTLTEVLSGIISSLNQGRNLADSETIRNALRYKQDPMLQALSVPRLRFDAVRVSIPMIISQLIPGNKPQMAETPVITRKVKDDLYQSMLRMNSWIKDRKEALQGGPGSHDKEKLSRMEDYQYFFGEAVRQNFLEVYEKDLDHMLTNDFGRGHLESGELIRDWVADRAEESLDKILQIFAGRYLSGGLPKQGQKSGLETPPDPKGKKKAPAPKSQKEEVLEFLRHKIIFTLRREVRRAADEAALSIVDHPMQIEVEIDSELLENAAQGGYTVTRLDLELKEDGLEWSSEQGREVKKLTG